MRIERFSCFSGKGLSGLKEPAALARYEPELKRAQRQLGTGARFATVGTIEDPLPLDEPPLPERDVLVDVLNIRRVDAPEGVDAYGFKEAGGEPVVLLWSTKGAPKVQLRSRTGGRFRLKMPGAAMKDVPSGMATIQLPELLKQEFNFGPIHSTTSDGVLPVEVRGLRVEDLGVESTGL